MLTRRDPRRLRLFVVLLAGILCHSGRCAAQKLTIQPSDTAIKKALGSTLQAMCKSDDASAVAQDMRWYSPRRYFPAESEPNRVKSRASMPREQSGGLARIYSEASADSRDLTITNIQAQDIGTYTCKGRVGGIEFTRDFNLSVFEPLRVDASARQFLILGDESSEIRCDVKGSPSPVVSWMKDDVRVSSNAGSKYELRNTGLTVYNPEVTDKGIYTCRGVMFGEVADAEITVDVYTRPVMSHAPWIKGPRMFGVTGDSVVLGCNATGYPAPQFKWYLGSKDNVGQREINDIYHGTRFRPNAVNGDLNIIELRLDDTGYYWCQASNGAGSVTSQEPVNLSVYRTPYFSWIQNSTTEPEGGTATIICQSQSFPASNLTLHNWVRPRAYIDGVQPDDSRITTTQKVSLPMEEQPLLQGREIHLTIRNLTPTDMSNYTCRATNAAGSNETTLELKVNFKPIFVEDSKVVYNWEGNRRNLTCRAKAWPLPQFRWGYLGTPISDSNVYKIYFGWMSSSLEINVPVVGLGHNLWGSYLCVAENQMGSSERRIDLREAQLPDPPVNLTKVKVTATSVTLSVDLPTFTGGIPLLYAEVLPQIPGDQAAVVRRFMLSDIRTLEITDLRPATEYALRVSLRNERGAGRDSSLRVSTLRASKPGAVPIISANTSSASSSYVLIWDSPDNGGLPIIEYTVKWRKAMERSQWISAVVASTVTSYSLPNLSKRTLYEVQVLATNKEGTSDEVLEPFQFTTADADETETSDKNPVGPPGHVSAINLGPFEEYQVIIIAVVGFFVVLLVIDAICCCTRHCGFLMCLHKACPGGRDHLEGKGDPDAVEPLTLRPPAEAGKRGFVMPQQALDDSEKGHNSTRGLLDDVPTKPLVPRKPAIPMRVFAPSREPDDREPGETNVDEVFADTSTIGSTAAKPTNV